MRIDIFSDVICPWCFIGKRRLERALAARPDLRVEVVWRAFQLNPDMPPAGIERRNAILDRKQRRSKLMKMKHALCSFVLLIMISATGLLVGSKSASAASITITEQWEELHNSKWKGSWEATQYTSRGRAELYLVRMGNSTFVRAKFSIYGSYTGDYSWRMEGIVYGNTIELKTRTSKIVLFLSEENGELVLSGGYEMISGKYEGDTGTYYFKKVK